MNRIIIIGNGFDKAHNMPTSDLEFVYWYFSEIFNNLKKNKKHVDDLCHIEIVPGKLSEFFKQDFDSGNDCCFKYFNENKKSFQFDIKELFGRIISSVYSKKEVDMEDEYYFLLKKYVKKRDVEKSEELNKQQNDLLNKYVEYLTKIQEEFLIKCEVNEEINQIFLSEIKIEDVSVEWNGRLVSKFDHWNYPGKNIWLPEKTLVLNFNYTQFAEKKYLNDKAKYENIYIHGNISDPKDVLFGYGDELDDDFHELLETNNNELLMNNKSIRVLEKDNYRKLLRFLYSGPYQILILGLSCGKSDRTLLNTLFEHNNCFSIKPYYYKRKDGSDNYLEIIQNITRCFTDAKKVRDRVVSKERCSTLPQSL